MKRKTMALTLIVILTPLFLYVLVGTALTLRVRSFPEQALFEKGTLPSEIPNGFLKGKADNQGSWLGKTFNGEEMTGINNFRGEEGNEYTITPFKLYTGDSVSDAGLKVIKIDYNVPENPIYLRFILDEIVEIAPGKYLGKLNLRLLPFVPFTVQYFRLEK